MAVDGVNDRQWEDAIEYLDGENPDGTIEGFMAALQANLKLVASRQRLTTALKPRRKARLTERKRLAQDALDAATAALDEEDST